MPFNYRNSYSKYGYYNNPFQNNYMNRSSNENISYNQGKRGSSNGVIVYGNGKSTSKSGNISNSTRVTYYNVGRSSTLQNGKEFNDKNISIRSYKDFIKDNNPTNRNIQRNRIFSRPEMGTVSSSGIKTRSSRNDTSRRYYTNPTSTSTGRPAKSTQYNWGLGGRNNYSRNSSVGGVRSYNNPNSNSSSSSRSYSSPSSSSSNYSRPTNSSRINTSSSVRGSSSSASSVRGSR